MSSSDPASPRRRLLAGSLGPERTPARPNAEDPRWFEPLHVRAETEARERMATQVAAGADVVVAPTWLTHRRALLPLGETRQAGSWTAAAVRVARDAVEVGLEGRRQEIVDGPAPKLADELRPSPLVGAVLPALDDVEPGTGHLLPREAATTRDYRDQAGLLADAEPDLILVEGSRAAGADRVAIEEARATGVPVWATDAVGRPASQQASETHTHPGIDENSVERWLEVSRHAGAEVALLSGTSERWARLAAAPASNWGVLLHPGSDATQEQLDEAVATWLERGARHIAVLDGASAKVLALVRHAVDKTEAVDLAGEAAIEERWVGHVSRAAHMTSGGAALWLETTSHHAEQPPAPNPDGFEWLALAADETQRLPDERFQLIVAPDAGTDSFEHLGRALHEGGLLVVRVERSLHAIEGLRLLVLDTDAEPGLAILRRER